MLNWLSSDEDLISIRPKDQEDRRLNLNQRQMTLLYYESDFGIPLLVVITGLSVWWLPAMKWTRLLIAAVLLGGLGGVLWWSNKDEAKKEAAPPKDDKPKILTLNETGIDQIEIHKSVGDVTTVLKKDNSGKWVITAPKQYAADQGAVAGITSGVSNLAAERALDDASDLASYGLDPAAVTVTFTSKDGKATKLLIGDKTPTDNNVYAKVDGDKRVFTMAGSRKADFDKAPKDLRERHLLMAEQDKLSRVELDAKGQSIEFGHAGDAWQILKPKPMRADGAQVEEVVRKARDAVLDAESADDTAKNTAAFASATPTATIRVTDPAGTKTLEIRKAKDDCYAKSSMLANGVFKANKELCDGLDKPLDNFRNKKLFDFAFSDPTKLTVKDNGKEATYEKTGDGWKSGGKTMDAVGIQNLIDKLRDASGAKFVDSGFTAPITEITVVSNDGKLTEKVAISQANNTYYAQRSGDATIYQMDSMVVDDIRKAADIQPSIENKAGENKKDSGTKK